MRYRAKSECVIYQSSLFLFFCDVDVLHIDSIINISLTNFINTLDVYMLY